MELKSPVMTTGMVSRAQPSIATTSSTSAVTSLVTAMQSSSGM
jgi:hypothetical protein